MLTVLYAGLLYFVICNVAGSSSTPAGSLPTDRPLNIAHRGSSGMLPEHTVEAYRLAVDQGADVIECDVCVTKDLKLVCSHEPELNASTDVHGRAEFRNRARTYEIESKNVTDYFTVDFTLEELKTLRKVQTRRYRDQSHNGKYAMASFDEYVAVAQNSSNANTIGIYPETKHPSFFNKIMEPNGTTMEELLLASLNRHGYTTKDSPCFVQSFDITSLERIQNRTGVRLVYLIEDDISDEDMQKYSPFISGIGPWKQSIVEVDYDNMTIKTTTDFVERAHKHGYLVHPYTFRNEYQFLAFEYGADPYKEYEQFINLGVDGLFTDFPMSLANYLQLKKGEGEECPTSSADRSYACTLVVVAILIARRMLGL